ncbi:MAG TPA: hypothetical protein VKJ45_22725 [Blastocatellia bacterium]|nr:hypothetical protein [Blastocatellia bacterium]
MPLISVLVECYAGSKAFERPRRVLIDGLAHDVVETIASWVEEDAASRVRCHRFEVRIDDGRKLLLIRRSDQWFLET